MTALTREQILAAQDLRTETVDVKEWGGSVIVRTMTGVERDQFEGSIYVDGRRDLTNFRAKLCCLCIVDEAGKRVFEMQDVLDLGNKSAEALGRVFEVAQRLNGIGRGAEEAAIKN